MSGALWSKRRVWLCRNVFLVVVLLDWSGVGVHCETNACRDTQISEGGLRGSPHSYR